MRGLLRQEIFGQRKFAIMAVLDSFPGPEGNEFRLRYPTMESQFAVQIGGALPRDDRTEVWWLERGHAPLRHRQIRNSQKADSPGTPRLRSRPFDQVVVVFRVLLSQ